jgi:fused signal recognition particle receptor
VCCPQINREGNNNNNCWQSVSSVVGGVNVRCSTSSSDRRVGFLGRLGRVFKEKAKSDIQLLFSGFSKTRENLAVVDELLTYWNLSDSENILDELEEVLLVSDFGPRTAMKIVDGLRKDILKGTLKSGPDIKVALKRIIVRLLTENVSSTELQLGQSRPAVIMIVGVNGGGKTTTIGKLAHRFKNENVKVLMAAGDTFRAAASEQLEVWAERTGSEIVVGEGSKPRPATGKINAEDT